MTCEMKVSENYYYCDKCNKIFGSDLRESSKSRKVCTSCLQREMAERMVAQKQ